MYRIKMRGTEEHQLHDMKNLIVSDSEFTGGGGLSFYRVRHALVTHNRVAGGGSPCR
jgi:hypothetical protein